MEESKSEQCETWASCSGWLIAAVLALFVVLTLSLVVLERADFLQSTADAEIINICALAFLTIIVAFEARDASVRGWGAARGNTRPIANALSASAVWLPAGSLVPLFAITYALGFDGLAFVLGPAAGLVIGGVLLLPYLARSGALTTAEFLGLRYNAVTRMIAAFIVALISLLLASAALAGFAILLESAFNLSPTTAVMIGVAAALVCTLPGGMMSVSWTGIVLAVVMLAGVLIAAVCLMYEVTGWGIPQLAYGELLGRIGSLERSMLEKELASAETLTPHLRPYLQLDEPNFFALLFCLAAGTAALPQVLARSFTVSSARDARSSGAWTTLFAVILLVTVPVYAALAKYNLYKTVDERVALASLPDWSKDLSRTSGMQIHGVSLDVFEAVAAGVQEGAEDVSAISYHLDGTDSELGEAWNRLEAPVRAEILNVAKASAGDTTSSRWEQFRTKLLPAVAALSENETGQLTLTGLDVDGGTLTLALPQIEGLPYAISGMLLVAALAAAMAMLAASVMTAAIAIGYDMPQMRFADDNPGRRETMILRLAVLACLLAAGALVMLISVNSIIEIAPAALSIAAAALLPALSLGIWWKRANAWGAIAGMVGGLAIVLYYLCAPHIAPVAFFETWAQLSNADPDYAMEFWTLHDDWLSASGEAKETARTALEAFATGTLLRPSLANWFGVMPLAAGALAVPVSFALTVLVSLITPRPQTGPMDLVARLRQPSVPEQ